MKINIRREVFIDTEVDVSIEDIQSCIAEACDCADTRSGAIDLIVMCWKTLHGLTDAQIELLGNTRPIIAQRLRELAARFD